MLTAQQFWTPEKRAKFNAWRQPPRYTAHWLPPEFRRVPEARQQGGIIERGPHKGFRFHDAWPSGTNYMRSCKGGDKAAMRILNHHGWFTDSFADGVVYACAVKIRVPRRRAKIERAESDCRFSEGQPTRVRWVEATEHSDWDQICISRRDLHDTLEDAIRGADRVAELSAEEAREEDAKDRAEQRIASLRIEIDESKDVIASCKKEIEDLCPSHDFARGVLVERIQAEVEAIAKAEARIKELENDFWRAIA